MQDLFRNVYETLDNHCYAISNEVNSILHCVQWITFLNEYIENEGYNKKLTQVINLKIRMIIYLIRTVSACYEYYNSNILKLN